MGADALEEAQVERRGDHVGGRQVDLAGHDELLQPFPKAREVLSAHLAAQAHRDDVSAVRPDVDEFELAGLTAVPSEIVRAPRVKESKISMECKLYEVVEIGRENFGGAFVMGEIVRFHVADELFDNYRIDPDGLRTIGRMGGMSYTRTRDRFDLERPDLAKVMAALGRG